MAFNDVLFDARKLVEAIEPAAWGQGFAGKQDDCGAYPRGEGILLGRVIDCLKAAKRAPAPNEGYKQEPSSSIYIDLVRLTIVKNPLCKSSAELRATLANVHEENGHHFSHGEKELVKALQNLVGDENAFKFYLVFYDQLDKLLEILTRQDRHEKGP